MRGRYAGKNMRTSQILGAIAGIGVIGAGVIGAGVAGAALAQVQTIDPNQAASRAAQPGATRAAASSSAQVREEEVPESPQAERAAVAQAAPPAPPAAKEAAAQASAGSTFQENDVLAAAEGVFGKGAKGLGSAIESVFRKQGRPNGYIVGREVGGAIIAGVRYGSGTLFHKVEGERPTYWQGPSVGFDLGANGAKTFILVYNLYDTQDLYRRYPAVEGSAFMIGGFQGSYLQRGHIILVPIRLGVGWRLGANLGYLRFTEQRKWSPF
jgi:hypothetical protein